MPKAFASFSVISKPTPFAPVWRSRGRPWAWSSANAHSLGHDPDDLLTFDRWCHIFGNPDTIIADWLTYVNGPLNEVSANAARTQRHSGSRVNRPMGWASSPSPPAD